MYINKGGEMYGFCPGKSTWDPRIKGKIDELIVIAETGWKPLNGGLYDQPADLIDLLGWFLPKYDFMKFFRKADMMLGSGEKKSVKSGGTQPSAKEALQKRR